MGELIEFPSNGSTGEGWSSGGGGPGVVVIQEWWGLNDHIKEVCDRLGGEGFTVLAPDLYNGKTVDEPDEAAKAMMAMNVDEAARLMSGAVDEVARRAGDAAAVGVVGFCMGGGLAYVVACQRPDKVKALVPFYGVIPWPSAQPDYSRLEAKVLGHYAEHDDFASPAVVSALQDQLRELGKDVEFIEYPGTGHAFFNDTNLSGHDPGAAQQAWERTVAFLHSTLD